jgi:hypothetical protein
MKLRLQDALYNLDENELYQIQEDLKKGSPCIRRLVSERIKELEKSKLGTCVTCGNELQQHPKCYTLLFGPDDFRKKASFCEIDCLEYFLGTLKSVQKQANTADQVNTSSGINPANQNTGKTNTYDSGDENEL